MIPRILHYCFGLEEKEEPFHFLHYLAIESARAMIEPEAIYFHHRFLPSGPLFDLVAPYLTPVKVDLSPEVLEADYSAGHVPEKYRYAHHADVIRLDALLERGGVYADIDVVFVRPIPQELFEERFVIGAEEPVRDELTGELRPSLCNAVLMSRPQSAFARAWRERLPRALNGTWSNHSGFLARGLAEEMPDEVRLEPAATFYPFAATPKGLAGMLTERHQLGEGTLAVHLWAHLWWERTRRDFTFAHEAWCTGRGLRAADSTLGELARPYLARADRQGADRPTWSYLSYDEPTGYGVAADRLMAALEESGQPIAWSPYVPSRGSPLFFDAAPPFQPIGQGSEVVVAHLVPENLPGIRAAASDALLVSHTVWETNTIPPHWVSCLEEADLVVVPSRFSAAAISAGGVTTPVAVVPHVAPAVRQKRASRFDDIASSTYVFYTVAAFSERKAVHLTVEAYLRAFRAGDPVVLVIKSSAADLRRSYSATAGPTGEGSTSWALARLLAGRADHPAIRLVTTELTEEEISSLHARGDCFVSLARGEGFGLGAFEAAVHGKPVVTTGYGGQLDFLGGSEYLVDYHLVPVEDPAGYPSYAPDQSWAEPDLHHASELLRRVFEERVAAAVEAGERAGEIQRRFSKAAVAAAMREAVAARLGR